MSRNHKEIPYGPLRYRDWSNLAVSFYDEASQDVQRLATNRGIKAGEFMSVHIKFVKEGIDPIVDPYHRKKSFIVNPQVREQEDV